MLLSELALKEGVGSRESFREIGMLAFRFVINDTQLSKQRHSGSRKPESVADLGDELEKVV